MGRRADAAQLASLGAARERRRQPACRLARSGPRQSDAARDRDLATAAAADRQRTRSPHQWVVTLVSALKTIAKRAVVSTVARAAPLTWRWRRPGSLVVLMYHRVLPKDSPARRTEQPGMYVSPETFDL